MDIIQLLNDLVSKLSDLQSKLVDAQAALEESNKLSYEKGFADGVASVPKDKIYSQEELDAAVKLAVDPLNEKIASLQSQVDGIPSKIEEAVKELKAQVKSDLDALEEKDL